MWPDVDGVYRAPGVGAARIFRSRRGDYVVALWRWSQINFRDEYMGDRAECNTLEAAEAATRLMLTKSLNKPAAETVSHTITATSFDGRKASPYACDALPAAETPPAGVGHALSLGVCCAACYRDGKHSAPFRPMILCPKCGNKRCPRADSHANACTNSNEPGQVATPAAEPRDEGES